MSRTLLRLPAHNSGRAARARRRTRGLMLFPGIEPLETRITPTVYTWTGWGSDALWSNGSNWDQGGGIPDNGDDLVFPSGASRLSNTNDIASLFPSSITMAGGGYLIQGNMLGISNSITTSYSSGTSEIDLDISVQNSDLPINVDSGGKLILGGQLIDGEGSGGLTIAGGGTLVFAGGTANSYTNGTNVDSGTLQLGKAANVAAIVSPLTIGSGATVQLLSPDQISDSIAVSISQSGTLDLNNQDELIGSLTLTGAAVTTGTGTLTLLSNVQVNSSSTTSVISGRLDLGTSSRQFNVVDNASTDYELNITATIGSSGGGIEKIGTGVLTLGGVNTYIGPTHVSAGAIRVENSDALGTTDGGTTVESGASLQFFGNGLSVPESLILHGNGLSNDGAIYVVAGVTDLTGPISLPNGDAEIHSLGTLTLSGAINDDGESYSPNYTSGSSGLIVVSGNNTYTQNTLIRSGRVRAASSNAFGLGSFASTVTVSSGATLELAGEIVLPANKSLSLDGLPLAGTSKVTNFADMNTIAGNISLSSNNQAFFVGGSDVLKLTGVISGSVDYDKNGPGVLVIEGSSTATGRVNVGEGTLLVNGDISSSSLVFVDGTLGGTGKVGAVELSGIGILSPGDPQGTLQTGNLTFDEGSAFIVQLNGVAVDSDYDQVDTAGTVSLGSPTLSVSLGFSPAANTVFTIINNDGSDPVAGSFNGLAEGATFQVGIQTFKMSYVGGDGNDVTLTALPRIDTWTGAGGDSNWTTAGNWAGNIAPIAGDQLVFPASASAFTATNNFTSGTAFGSITIEGTGYTLAGNSVRLDGGIKTTYSTGSQAFSIPVILNADQNYDIAAGGTFVVQAVLSGSHSLTKIGDGSLGVSTLNSFSGGTSVQAGILNLLTSNTLMGSGTVTVAAGATIGFNGSASLPNALIVGGTGFGGAGAIRTYGNSSSDAITGNVTLTSDLLITVAAQSQIGFNGAISGPYSITSQGGGTISLSGNVSNTFDGSYTQKNTFTVAAKSGGATAIPHDLILSSGTFLTQRDEQIADTATLYVQAGAEFDLLNSNETIGAIDFTGGIVTSNSTVLTLKSGGTITSHASSSTAGLLGTIDLNGAECVITTDLGTPANGNDLVVSATLRNGSIKKLGAGNLALAPTISNTFAGGTDIRAGKVSVSKSTSFGTAGVSISDATVVLTGNITLDNNFSISSNIVALQNNSGSNTITGTVVLSQDLIVSTATSTTLSLSGAISDGGDGYDLTKIGTGTLQLLASNSYQDTNINAGTLQVGATTATGTAGQVVMAGGTSLIQSVASYALPSGGLQIGTSSSYNVSGSTPYAVTGPINLTGDTSFITSSSTASLDVLGVISGSAGFSKLNGGRLTLSGVNTFTGNVTVGAGTLAVTSTQGLGSTTGSTSINDGAALEFNLTGSPTIFEPLIVGSAGGTATINQVGGSFTYGGTMTLQSTAAVDASGGTLTVSGSIIDGSGVFGINKSGASSLELGGSNSFDGAVNILAGSIVVSNSSGLGSTTGRTTISDGAGLILSTGAGTIAEPFTVGSSGGTASITNLLGTNKLSGPITLVSTAAIGLSGGSLELAGSIGDGSGILGLNVTGSADLILSGSNTFDGSVLLTGGTATVRNGQALGSNTSGTLVASTAKLVLDLPGTTSLNEPFALSGNGATIQNVQGNNTLAGPIVLTAAENFTVDGGSLSITGPLSGSGGFDKRGTGTLSALGHSSYAGNTHVVGGYLLVGLADGLSNTNVTVDLGATLGIKDNITLGTASITLTGNGVNGVGALENVSGNNTYGGSISLAGPTTIGASQGGLTISGTISGPNGLTKTGGSTLTLSGANTYTGATTISQGAIEARNNNAFGGSASVHIGAAGQLLLKNVSIATPLSIDGSTNGVASVDGTGAIDTLSGPIAIHAQFNVGAEAGNTLVISGVVDNTNAQPIVKLGAGTVQFTNSGNIMPSGATLTTDAGQVLVTNASALGASELQAQNGGEFVLVGGVTVSNDILVSGSGPNGGGAIRNSGGNNVFSGNILLTGNGTIGIDAGSLALTGDISDGGGTPFSLTKIGTGTLTLQGSNTYSGPTDINGGTLIVDGSTGTGTVTVHAGAVLGGHGTTGPVSVLAGGTYSPGNSPNTITVASLTLTTGSTYVEEIDGNTPGDGTTGYDKTIVTTGPVQIQAGVTLNATLGGGYVPAPGDVLTIIDNQGVGPIQGTFNGFAEGSTLALNGKSFLVSYVGGTGNDLTLTYVTPTTTTVTAAPNPSIFGQSVTFTATVRSAPDSAFIPVGSVNFFDGSTLLASATLDGQGRATMSTNGLSAVIHGITAVYGGGSSYFPSTSPLYLQAVNKADTSVGLSVDNASPAFGQPLTFTATVQAVAPGAGGPGGNVMFVDGATVLGISPLFDNGGVQTAVFTALNLVSSFHQIHAIYQGDASFNGNSGSLGVTVAPASTWTTITGNGTSVAGETILITAHVGALSPAIGVPTGTVQIMLDTSTVLATATLGQGGTVTVPISSIAVGAHTLSIAYTSDSVNYLGSTSSSANQQVNKANTFTSLGSSVDPSVFGQAITYTATVTSVSPGSGVPTGTVTFRDGTTVLGTASLSSGIATLTTSAFSVGNHSVTATYSSGDASFNASASSFAINQLVMKDNTSATLLTSVNPTVFGQSTTFTATITANAPGAGTPTGVVTFYDGLLAIGVGSLSAGIATFSTSALDVGSHSITAAYTSGDGSFNPSASSSVVTQVVRKADSSILLGSSVNPSVNGQSVTFTATVSAAAPGAGTPTGTVTFLDGATTLGTGTLEEGVATFTTTTLSVGSHSITAVYTSGDESFNPSGASLATAQVVNPASTTTVLTSSQNPQVLGGSVTFTATTTVNAPGGGAVVGSIQFSDGSVILGTVALVNGSASFTTSGLSKGNHGILATFIPGNGDDLASTSQTLNQSIITATSTVTVTTSLSPSRYGQAVTFTAIVSASTALAGVPTGTVTFYDGDTVIGTATLSSGMGSITVSTLGAGTHSITARYSGNTPTDPGLSPELVDTVLKAVTSTTLFTQTVRINGRKVPSLIARVNTVTQSNIPASGTVVLFARGRRIGAINIVDGVGRAPLSVIRRCIGSVTGFFQAGANFLASRSNSISR